MPMRQTIGMSLALLVISAGAMAKTPEKNAPHHQAQPSSAKSEKGNARTVGTSRPSHKVAQHHRHLRSAARRGAEVRHSSMITPAIAYQSSDAPDAYWGPMVPTGIREIGVAAWYDLVGNRTSSGERLDTVTATAAHRSLPLSSYAKVTNLDSGRSVIVKINDRGPHARRFIIDLSPRAAEVLEMRRAGTANVMVEPVVAATVPFSAIPQIAAYRP
jgi:rare lipoprotein A